MDVLEEPAQRFQAEQQATGHLIGSQRPDHMLIHGQDVAQAAIEWSLLIDCSAARRLADELHHIHADADDVRIGGGKQCTLPFGRLPAVAQSSPMTSKKYPRAAARSVSARPTASCT